MRTTLSLRIAVLAAVTLLAPAARAETLVKETTATMDIEAAPELAKWLAADVRGMEAMMQRTGLGKKPGPKERIRYVVVGDRKLGPERAEGIVVMDLNPSADPEVVRAELRNSVADLVLDRWTDGAASSLSQILRVGLRNVVMAFEPPGPGERIPRPRPAGEKLLATVRYGERGENPIDLRFMGDPAAHRGGNATGEAVILYAIFGESADAKLLRTKVRGALDQGERRTAFWRRQNRKISEQSPPNGVLKVDEKDRARLEASVMAWVRYGAASPAEAKAAFGAAVRELCGRLGIGAEPFPEVPSGDGPVDERAILIAYLEAVAPKAPWIRAGIRRLTSISGLGFGRFDLRVQPEHLWLYYDDSHPDGRVSLKEILEAEASAFDTGLRSDRFEGKASTFVAYLAREGAVKAAAIAADPTVAGVEKALEKSVAEVDASITAFARKEAEAIRGPIRRRPSGD